MSRQQRRSPDPRGNHYQCGDCPFATADPSQIDYHYTSENHRPPTGTPVGQIGNPGVSKLHRFKNKDGEELRYAYFGLPEYDVTVNRKKRTVQQAQQAQQPHQRERKPVVTGEQEAEITSQITPKGSSRAHRRHRRIQTQKTESRGNH